MSNAGGIVSTKFITNGTTLILRRLIHFCIPFLDRDIPGSPSCGVCVLWRVRFFFFFFCFFLGGGGAVLVVVASAVEANFKFYNKDIDAVGSMVFFF